MKKAISVLLTFTLSAYLFCGCENSDREKTTMKIEKETSEISSEIQNESTDGKHNSNENDSTDEKHNSDKNESITSETSYTDSEYLFVYDDLLLNTYHFIADINSETIAEDEQLGILEAVRNEDGLSALSKIGYCKKDLNNDGIPELLIMQIDDKTSDSYVGSRILAAYTYKHNVPFNILVGTSRNRYYLFEDNTIFNEGSNGAAYTIFGTYHLSKDKSQLAVKDFYFTSPIDNDYSQIGFFHNTVGEIDLSKSKEFEGSEDDFWTLSNDLSNKIKSYEVISFEAFDESNEVNIHEFPVSGTFMEDAEIDRNHCYEFIADTSEFECQVVFSANETVTDFQFNSLEYIENPNSENIDFLMTPLFSLDELTSDKPVVITLTFLGTIPNYGISYIDASGTQRTFSIEVSGMDGSLLITEY